MLVSRQNEEKFFNSFKFKKRSLTYLRGLEVAELEESDMPMV